MGRPYDSPTPPPLDAPLHVFDDYMSLRWPTDDDLHRIATSDAVTRWQWYQPRNDDNDDHIGETNQCDTDDGYDDCIVDATT